MRMCLFLGAGVTGTLMVGGADRDSRVGATKHDVGGLYFRQGNRLLRSPLSCWLSKIKYAVDFVRFGVTGAFCVNNRSDLLINHCYY